MKVANENSLPLQRHCEIWGAVGQRKAAWMNVRMLSGVNPYRLTRKEHALHLCFQITVQKCNQSARQLPRHISPYRSSAAWGRAGCFASLGKGTEAAGEQLSSGDLAFWAQQTVIYLHEELKGI